MTDPRGAGRGFLHGWKSALAFGFAGALIGAALVALFSGELVRRHLLANPEIIPEAMERLRDREAAEAVSANRAALETPFAGAWAGAADGDVVLVEFFDYACGYCRRSNADIDRLLAEDPKLKVVWREWPVLGPDSLAAAEASLAAARAGRFRPFYKRLFELGPPDAETIAEAQRAAGLTDAQVEQVRASPEAQAELARNNQLAVTALRATGTPTFVVGDQVLQGAVGYEALKEAIEETRAG